MKDQFKKFISIFLIVLIVSLTPASAQYTSTPQPQQPQTQQQTSTQEKPTVTITTPGVTLAQAQAAQQAQQQLQQQQLQVQQQEFKRTQIIPTGDQELRQDFAVQIVDYEPKIVRSDLLAETAVPVYAQLALVKINPIIEEPNIKSISPSQTKPNPAVAGLSYYRSPQERSSLRNAGYLVALLKQQPDERKIPDKIEIDGNLTVIYDYQFTPGIREEDFTLRPLKDEEFQATIAEHAFWNKAGYLRVLEIRGNLVKVQVYNGFRVPIATFELNLAQEDKRTSQPFRLTQLGTTSYTGRGFGIVKLRDVKSPIKRAEIIVNVEGITKVRKITEQEDLYEGSQWQVKQIVSDGRDKSTGSVLLRNKFTGEEKLLKLRSLTSVVESVINLNNYFPSFTQICAAEGEKKIFTGIDENKKQHYWYVKANKINFDQHAAKFEVGIAESPESLTKTSRKSECRTQSFAEIYEKGSDDTTKIDDCKGLDIERIETRTVEGKVCYDVRLDERGKVTPSSVKLNLKNAAESEFKRWGSGSKKETDATMKPIVASYNVAGNCPGNTGPWSGAFISYVAKQAGITDFPSSCSHTTYFQKIKDNPGICRAYSINEKNKINVGDIICQCRDKGCPITFDNVIPEKPAHCDIVTKVLENGKKVKAIGGNLDNTVNEIERDLTKPEFFGFISCGEEISVLVSGISKVKSEILPLVSADHDEAQIEISGTKLNPSPPGTIVNDNLKKEFWPKGYKLAKTTTQSGGYYRAFISEDGKAVKTYFYESSDDFKKGISSKVIIKTIDMPAKELNHIKLIGTKDSGYIELIKIGGDGKTIKEKIILDPIIPYEDVFDNLVSFDSDGDIIYGSVDKIQKAETTSQQPQQLEQIKSSKIAYQKSIDAYWKIVYDYPYTQKYSEKEPESKTEQQRPLAVDALKNIFELAKTFNDDKEQRKALRYLEENYPEDAEKIGISIKDELERIEKFDLSDASKTIEDNKNIVVLTLRQIIIPQDNSVQVTILGKAQGNYKVGDALLGGWKVSKITGTTGAVGGTISGSVNFEREVNSQIVDQKEISRGDETELNIDGKKIKVRVDNIVQPQVLTTQLTPEPFSTSSSVPATDTLTYGQLTLNIQDTLQETLREQDRFLGYVVEQIQQDRVILSKNNRPALTLRTGFSKLPGGADLSISQPSLQQEATLAVVPYTFAGRSRTPFTIHISVEKRLIQLSPEAMARQANSSRKLAEKITKVTDNLGNTISTWKKACFATTAALITKNFVQGWQGEGIARQKVMDRYKEICSKEVGFGKKYKNYHECFLANSKQIDSSIETVKDAIKKTNAILKEVTLEKDDFLQVDSEKLAVAMEREFGIKITDDLSAIKKYEDETGERILLPSEIREFIFNAAAKQSTEQKGLVVSSNFNEAFKSQAADYSSKATEFTKLLDDFSNVKTEAINKQLDVEKEILFEDFLQLYRFRGTGAPDFAPRVYRTKNNVPYILEIKTDGGGRQFVFTPVKLDPRGQPLVEREKEVITITNEKTTKKEFVPLLVRQSCVTTSDGHDVRYYGSGAFKDLPESVPFPFEKGEGFIKILKYDKGQNVQEAYIRAPVQGICDTIYYKRGADVSSRYSGALDSALTSVRQAITFKPRLREGGVISIFGKNYKIGKAVIQKSTPECADYMSIQDCEILFQVCDPVLCPPSRCDFGGRWQVADVVQTGVSGSILLCAPNFPHPVVPICLTGVRAGLQNYASILNAYSQCMDESRLTGKTSGICDQIRSIYVCELLWREGLTIANAQGGVIDLVSKTIFKEQTKGGVEYLNFKDSFNKVSQSVSYFTTQYAAPAFSQFRARTGQELGGYICRAAFFGRLPGTSGVFEELSKPESPPQFFAYFEEIPHSSVNSAQFGVPQSQYKVFFHIFAGEHKGIFYRVYLTDPAPIPGYAAAPQFIIPRPESSAFIPAKQFSDESLDFLAPSGYRQLCVDIDGIPYCGFGKVTSEFVANYVTDLYVKQQLEKEVKTANECISGSPSLLPLTPTLSGVPQAGISEAAQGGLLRRGITRVCSEQNPGRGADVARWKPVGSCGVVQSKKLTCWLDTLTVKEVIKDKKFESATLDQATKLERNFLEEKGFLIPQKAESSYESLQEKFMNSKTQQELEQVISEAKALQKQNIITDINAKAQFIVASAYHKIAIALKEKEPKPKPNTTSRQTESLQIPSKTDGKKVDDNKVNDVKSDHPPVSSKKGPIQEEIYKAGFERLKSITLAEGESRTFDVNGEKHTVKIVKIDNSKKEITVRIASEHEKEFILKRGKNKINGFEIDVDFEIKTVNKKNFVLFRKIEIKEDGASEIKEEKGKVGQANLLSDGRYEFKVGDSLKLDDYTVTLNEFYYNPEGIFDLTFFKPRIRDATIAKFSMKYKNKERECYSGLNNNLHLLDDGRVYSGPGAVVDPRCRDIEFKKVEMKSEGKGIDRDTFIAEVNFKKAKLREDGRYEFKIGDFLDISDYYLKLNSVGSIKELLIASFRIYYKEKELECYSDSFDDRVLVVSADGKIIYNPDGRTTLGDLSSLCNDLDFSGVAIRNNQKTFASKIKYLGKTVP